MFELTNGEYDDLTILGTYDTEEQAKIALAEYALEGGRVEYPRITDIGDYVEEDDEPDEHIDADGDKWVKQVNGTYSLYLPRLNEVVAPDSIYAGFEYGDLRERFGSAADGCQHACCN